jgi:hypothetical protein
MDHPKYEQLLVDLHPYLFSSIDTLLFKGLPYDIDVLFRNNPRSGLAYCLSCVANRRREIGGVRRLQWYDTTYRLPEDQLKYILTQAGIACSLCGSCNCLYRKRKWQFYDVALGTHVNYVLTHTLREVGRQAIKDSRPTNQLRQLLEFLENRL